MGLALPWATPDAWADPVASPSIAGEWSVRKCFTSGSPSWTTVVGRCFDGTWTFTTDGTATDGGTFVGTWSGQHPDFTAAFDRRDGHTGSETVTALTMTSPTAATGDIRSVADCTGCGTAEGTVTLTRTAYHCTDGTVLTTGDVTARVEELEDGGAAPDRIEAYQRDPCGGDGGGCTEAGAADTANGPVVFLVNENGRICGRADIPDEYAELTVLDETVVSGNGAGTHSGLALGDPDLTKGANGPTINFFFGSGATERDAVIAAGHALAAYEDDPAHINTCYVFATHTLSVGHLGFTAVITAGCVP